MQCYEVTARITYNSNNQKSKKIIYAENKDHAREKFYIEIDKPENLDKKYFIIESIKELKINGKK